MPFQIGDDELGEKQNLFSYLLEDLLHLFIPGVLLLPCLTAVHVRCAYGQVLSLLIFEEMLELL